MNCIIYKKLEKKEGVITPSDIVVLNEEGNVAVFIDTSEAYDFMDEYDIRGEVEFVPTE